MKATLLAGRIRPHNERPAAVWSSGGRDYDQISRGIADALEHCVVRLNPQPGERILDLSTGTGWTSRLVARRGAAVIGADIAADLLEAAREEADFEGLPITYQIGDAEDLPFETGAFDAVVSTFGIMFASRPEVAAAEAARVCRKGGRIALTTWLSDSNLFKMFQVMRRYAPPPPAGPAPRSPFEWGQTGAPARASRQRICAAVRKGGLLLSRAERRGRIGYLSRPATVRRVRSPPASIPSGARRCARISSRFTRASRPSSASRSLVSIGSPSGSACSLRWLQVHGSYRRGFTQVRGSYGSGEARVRKSAAPGTAFIHQRRLK